MLSKVSIVITILLVGYIIFLIFNQKNNQDHPIGILKFDNDVQIVNPKAVDLTEEGTLDWAHWGFGAEEWIDS